MLTASAPALVARLEGLTGRPARLLPNAFNQTLFHAGSRPPRPADLPEGKAIALYAGSLWGGWMDWPLVRRLATELPDLALVFVGDWRGEGGGLPTNCHFLGLKPQDELPGYLAHAAVGVLPWRVDDVTRATSPLKVYEYLAMGLPVVAPPLDPLAGLPGVHVAADAEAFVTSVRARVDRPSPPQEQAAMKAFAATSSWAARVDVLLDLTEAAAQRPRQRDSNRSPRFQWSEWLRK